MSLIRFNLGSVDPKDGGPSVSGLAQILQYNTLKRIYDDIPLILELENNHQDIRQLKNMVQVIEWKCFNKPVKGISIKRLCYLLYFNAEIRISTGSWKFFDLLTCLQLFYCKKLKLVISPRGCFNTFQLSLFKKILLRFYILTAKRTGRLSFHFLDHSEILRAPENTRTHLQRYSFIAPNTIDTVALANDFQTLPNNEFDLGYFGRFVEEKNIVQLLEFAKTLKLRILLCGPPNQYKRQLEENYNSENIIFIDPLYGSCKKQFFERVSIVVLLSQSEGIPTSLLEAIYCKRPIICTFECNLPFDHVLIQKIPLKKLDLEYFKSALSNIYYEIDSGKQYLEEFNSALTVNKFWTSLHSHLTERIR
jgi:glycosyltransferase involved in cell wall biosynthesis